MIGFKEIKTVLRRRNVKVCLLGSFISTAGDCFNDIAVLSFVFIIYGSLGRISWIYTAVYIAMFLSSPLLGAISDKLEKRRIIVLSSIVQGLVVSLIIIFPDFKVILFCLFIETVLSVLVKLSIRSIIKDSVGTQELVLTNSLSTGIIQVTRVLSPALAGLLLALWSDDVYFATRLVLGIDVLSFFVSSVLFLFLSKDNSPVKPEKGNGSLLKDTIVGWKALKENKPISIFYTYGLLLAVAGTVPFLIKIPYIMKVLNGGPDALGFVNSFAAAGAIIGASLAAVFIKKAVKKSFLLFRILQGLCFILLGIIPNLPAVFVIFMMINIALNMAKISEESFQQALIDRQVFGRVSSWYISANAVVVLFMLRIGVCLDDLIGSQALYVFSGLWFVIVSLIFMRVMHQPAKERRIA